MKLKKSFVTLTLCFSLCVFPLVHASLPNPKIVVDGNQVNSEIPALIRGDRTLVPLRIISEYMGYKVNWNKMTKKISITSPSEKKEMILTIGEPSAQIAGSSVTLDCVPILEKECTFVPLRFIAEYYNKKVVWENHTRTVYIGDAPATVVKDQANILKDGTFSQSKAEVQQKDDPIIGDTLAAKDKH